jgi:hypothetical protein
MVFVDLVGPFTIRTPAKTHSLHALTMIDPAINTGWFEIVEATISQQHPSRICFITPGWHVTRDLNLWSLTSRQQANAIIERAYKVVYHQ